MKTVGFFNVEYIGETFYLFRKTAFFSAFLGLHFFVKPFEFGGKNTIKYVVDSIGRVLCVSMGGSPSRQERSGPFPFPNWLYSVKTQKYQKGFEVSFTPQNS